MNLKSIGKRLVACKPNIDSELLERSRIARIGNRIIHLAMILRVVEPLVLIAATLILTSAPAHAQGIFGGSDQNVGNGVREAIKWGRNLLFLMGIGGVGWGAVNYMMEKSFMKQMIGGGMAMGIGGVIELVRKFALGEAVNLDTDV
jgi:hypothetical protein